MSNIFYCARGGCLAAALLSGCSGPQSATANRARYHNPKFRRPPSRIST